MPTQKTTATEVSVILGLLDTDWKTVRYDSLPEDLKKSFSEDCYRQALEFYGKNPSLCDSLTKAGRKLRTYVPELSEIKSIQWKGPGQLARSVAISQDILVNNIPVSVKTESDVVYNLSPSNMFLAVPSGALPRPDKDKNWYITVSYDRFNELYCLLRDSLNLTYTSVLEFEEKAGKLERKQIQDFLKQRTDIYEKFMDIYVSLCHETAVKSAEIFNNNVTETRKEHPKTLWETIAKVFLRLNGTPYLLVSLENGTVFLLKVPDLTTFLRQFEFTNVFAQADLARRQSVVDIKIGCKQKNGKTKELKYHVEIRWSHGKFCGNPEAKLYKHFLWKDAPGFETLFSFRS